MNIMNSASRILYCMLGPPSATIMVADKLRRMINKNTIALIIDSEAIVFRKTYA